MKPFQKLFGSKLDPFLLELGQRHLWVVSLNQSNSAPFCFGEIGEEELKERLLHDIEETKGSQPRRLFKYDRKGRRILPVFSSSEAGVNWIEKKPFAPDSQMFAFTKMRMQTLVLFAKLHHAPATTYIMLDPETPQERELTPIEIRRTLEHFRP